VGGGEERDMWECRAVKRGGDGIESSVGLL